MNEDNVTRKAERKGEREEFGLVVDIIILHLQVSI